jgi:hypothetical protein
MEQLETGDYQRTSLKSATESQREMPTLNLLIEKLAFIPNVLEIIIPDISS